MCWQRRRVVGQGSTRIVRVYRQSVLITNIGPYSCAAVVDQTIIISYIQAVCITKEHQMPWSQILHSATVMYEYQLTQHILPTCCRWHDLLNKAAGCIYHNLHDATDCQGTVKIFKSLSCHRCRREKLCTELIVQKRVRIAIAVLSLISPHQVNVFNFLEAWMKWDIYIEFNFQYFAPSAPDTLNSSIGASI